MGLTQPPDLPVPEPVLKALETLEGQGHAAWLVGGCVRDLLQGLAPQDYDLASSALPQQVAALFPRHALTGAAHGTVTVFCDDFAMEVTTFRSEGQYRDARRPESVVFEADIEADLARRDFTINSMAYHPRRGLMDLFGGRRDLGDRILSCVGDPEERFREDALRLLRAVRFCVQLDFRPDERLRAAATKVASRVTRLSRERMHPELSRICGAAFIRQLSYFEEASILSCSLSHWLGLPAPSERDLIAQLRRWIRPGLSESQKTALLSLAVCDDFAAAARRRQAPLRDWHRRLVEVTRLSKNHARKTVATLHWIKLRLNQEGTGTVLPPVWRVMLQELCRFSRMDGPDGLAMARQAEALLDLGGLSTGLLRLQQFPPKALPPLTLPDLAIGGRELIAAGMTPGPGVQKMLRFLLHHVALQPQDNQEGKLLQIARSRGLST